MSLEAFVTFGSNNPITADNNAHPHWRGHVAQNCLQDIGRKFVGKKVKINSSTRLTTEGQRDEIAKAAREALAEIDDVRLKTLAPLQERRRKAQADFASVGGMDTAKDDIVGYLREAEIRTALGSMNESERLRAFQRAVEAEDLLVVRAVVNAPAFAPLLNGKVVDVVKEALIEKRHPGEAAALKDAEFVATAVGNDFTIVIAGIQKEGGIEPDMRTRLEGENQ